VQGAGDRLPARPRRVAVAGVSGSGKTTLARRISTTLGVPHTATDGLYHGPRWTPREEFVADVEALVAGDAWVTEWQYSQARSLIAQRAEVLVWLDLPFRLTLVRVVRRTVRRRVLRQDLWHGNREAPLWTLLTDRDHIVRWAVRTRRTYAVSVPQAERDHPHLTVVRLRTRRGVETWLARL